MDDINKQILDLMEASKYSGPTPFQLAVARGHPVALALKEKLDAEMHEFLVAEGLVRLSSFSGMPNKGTPITGPAQVYEDDFPRSS